jgi:two-component system, NarL family, sensor histidine kinase DesK
MACLIPHDHDLGWTPFAWLIYIVPFALTPLYTKGFSSFGGYALFIGATLGFLVLYFRGFWARGGELVLIAAAVVGMGLAFWPLSFGAGALFIYAAAMLGDLQEPKHAVWGVAIIALITTADAIYLRRDIINASWPVVFVILIGGINIHYGQVGRSNARLRLAHDEIEHLAKVAERERIARDLHDLLGHTLSLVILKSELATKLADRDPARAREEIRDVERIARDALAQVRSAVSGYRSQGLETEIQHARTALATAGVSLETDISKSQLPPSHEAVLSLAIREAATNIVRHAGARHCQLTLHVSDASCTLTVSDDGRGGNESFGSGLTGMRERVEVLNGTMHRDGRRGTKIVVSLPLDVAFNGARNQERTA